MRNIRLVLEYDGTAYAGWQVQKTLPTVQGAVMAAIAKLTGEEVKLVGASRTDAGVHAFGQAANFASSTVIPVNGIMHGLNSLLPDDIVVREAFDAPLVFDARRDSRSKTYVYRVLNHQCPSALLRRYSWFVRRPLDIALMRSAGVRLVGEKDFSSFRAADSDALHSVREVTGVEVHERGEGLIEIEVRGTAFLRHMVRIMAGTLVEAGKGRITAGDVTRIIEARDRRLAPMTAPAHGLFLMKVEY